MISTSVIVVSKNQLLCAINLSSNFSTLMHPGWQKLHRVLAVLSAIGLNVTSYFQVFVLSGLVLLIMVMVCKFLSYFICTLK